MSRRVRRMNCLALLAVLTSLVACSQGSGHHGAEHKRPLVLGFSQPVAGANWNTANTQSVRNASRDAGIELRLEDAHRRQ